MTDAWPASEIEADCALIDDASFHALSELEAVKRDIALADGALQRLAALKAGARKMALAVRHGFVAKQIVVDALYEMAQTRGVIDELGENTILVAIGAGLDDFSDPPIASNGQCEPAPATPWGPENYGVSAARIEQPAALPPLTIDEWATRSDLAAPDCLMGSWLTTTTRCLLYAPTGIGKSLKAVALGMHASAGRDFLHWRGRRPSRVLFIDGEMARRLLRERLAAEAERMCERPANFFALSHDDVENFAPLNTAAGQAYIDRLISELGGVDLIIFDAIMSLLVGDPKENEPWAQIMPWVKNLTKRNIGQVWIHHTGHDTTKGYGDKTREWQLDTVIALEPADNPETDVSFTLAFKKARERTPATRGDFADAKITLIGNEWHTDALTARKSQVSPLGLKFHQALINALASDARTTLGGRPAVPLVAWKTEAVRLGLIDPEGRPDSARNLFNKHKRELIAANFAACNLEVAWTL